ncbi:CPBP family intramembrane glutamic endopeptidase [Dyella sp. GSA-30]|uniref:CPBP family intramembrane glutamic endopeptidase n=1 Tax=Dyella sp. GSA-30 TaxID=2994496 RepID=UPI00249396C7|nr:CPBP family intramembrane glutamic endopeptidase [Dyella sp. GSA-30]BDU20249.1 CAAX amino protease [Dyella sp. GSA-30]
MQPGELAFTTPADAPEWQRWIVLSPLGRIVFFTITMIVLNTVMNLGLAATGFGDSKAAPVERALANLLSEVLPAVVAYLLLVRLIERRSPHELSPRTLPLGVSLGLVIGTVLFSAVAGVLWLLGVYHVTGTNPRADWLPALLTTGLSAGIAEEIITRGVLFRIVEEGMGTVWALVISALFFGAAHIFNPGATLWSSAAIAIEAGLMLGMLYHVTRSLWPCMGMHAAWNFMQGTVFGVPVSGTHADGWLVSYRTGPSWLSGGVFGAEASVVALLICSTFTTALLIVAWRRRSFIAPSWHRH